MILNNLKYNNDLDLYYFHPSYIPSKYQTRMALTTVNEYYNGPNIILNLPAYLQRSDINLELVSIQLLQVESNPPEIINCVHSYYRQLHTGIELATRGYISINPDSTINPYIYNILDGKYGCAYVTYNIKWVY